MQKMLSLIGSLMLLVGGIASAEPQAIDKGKIKAETKNIKNVKGVAAMNCLKCDSRGSGSKK